MGRHQKTVLDPNGIDRRETGYYSTPDFVSQYIAECLLQFNPNGKSVLDPCVGRGEMTLPFHTAGKRVIGFDVVDFSPYGVDDLKIGDFLHFYMKQNCGPLFNNGLLSPDYIVANPPYNCHESDYIRQNKSALASAFGKSAVLNMYSMFIKAIIDLAPSRCLIGIITLDSFLTARGYEDLRNFILDNCTVHRLHLCPTDLFISQGADVRTCIMILEKGHRPNIEAMTSNRPSSSHDFLNSLHQEKYEHVSQRDIVLHGPRDRNEFIIDVPSEIRDLFSAPRLGQLFPCITGISTGNDKRYLSSEKTQQFSVPFYKNPGSRRFFTEPDAYLTSDFLEIDDNVPNFMVRNKQYLFKGGISCSSMGVTFTASYLPDGATVGVNPNIIVNGDDRWCLMAYLNSSLCTYIVRGVLIRSNMVTAGYVSRIPVPSFSSQTKQNLLTIAQRAHEKKVTPSEASVFVSAIDTALFNELALSAQTKAIINDFVSDLIRRT